MSSWSSPRRLALVGVVLAVAVLLILPVLVIIPVGLSSSETLQFPPPGFSVRWYQHLLADPGWFDSLVSSLQIAFGTAALSLLLGLPMALGLVRGRLRQRRLLYGLVVSPLVVPSVITGTGMYIVWALGWQIGPITIGGGLYGTVVGIILAHTALALPIVVFLIAATTLSADRELELAAQGLGATPWGAFRFVLLPLILPGVAAGGVLAFLTSWDEAIVAYYLSTPTLIALPVRMFIQTRDAVDPTVAAISTLLSWFTASLFVFSLWVQGHRPAAASA